jgi:hypothetical protein
MPLTETPPGQTTLVAFNRPERWRKTGATGLDWE